jgi:hypothetical protein
MFEIPTPEQAPAAVHPVVRAFDRMGGYTLTFSIVFAAMVWASVLFLLPQFSAIEVLGARHALSDLPGLKAALLQHVEEPEAKRTALDAPLQHAVYAELKQAQSAWQLMHTWNDVQRVIIDTSGTTDILHLTEQRFDPTAKTITLVGDVRNSGPQSMTVLAEFLDSLAKLPGVASLSPVPFTRQNDPRIGEVSPFTVTITLP